MLANFDHCIVCPHDIISVNNEPKYYSGPVDYDWSGTFPVECLSHVCLQTLPTVCILVACSTHHSNLLGRFGALEP